MPIPGDDLDALAVSGPERSRKGKHAAEAEHQEADDHVRGVQADEGVEGRAEEIGPDREAVAVDEPVPFARGGGEKYRAERCGHQEPRARAPDVALAERA